MRTYPTDSPEAAARLLAMALVADGHYAISEIKALDRLSAPARLGLAPEAFKQVIDHFCEDLLLASHGEWLGSAAIDTATRTPPVWRGARPGAGRRSEDAVRSGDAV